MSWKDKLLHVFRRTPESDSPKRETEFLKTIQRETGENFPAAVERYRAFLQEHPDSRLGRTFLAGTLRLLGKWDEALEVLSELQQLERAEPSPNPNDLTTRLSIGQVLYDKGEFDSAIAEFESLLAEPPKVARHLHGIIYLS